MKLIPILPLAVLALASGAMAQTKTFSVGASGRAAAQVFTFESEAELEDFTGLTHKVTGNLSFDPKAKTGSGRIVVDIASIDTGIPMRNDHLRSATWFDAAKYPTATFETTKVAHKSGDTYTVTGKLTVKGVTKTITVPATVKYMPQSETTQRAGFKGDVLQVKTSFKVTLKDYNVTIPAPAQGMVGESVTIKLTVFGSAS
ncbi:MAG: hypothetical protein AMXMBFR81_18080 [Chthonomonas sp.]|nr:YceI family protein [Fimbriimonadaceae bacterium]